MKFRIFCCFVVLFALDFFFRFVGDWNEYIEYIFIMQSISWLCMFVCIYWRVWSTQWSDPDLIYSIKPLSSSTTLSRTTELILSIHLSTVWKISISFVCLLQSIRLRFDANMRISIFFCVLFFFFWHFENQFHYCSYRRSFVLCFIFFSFFSCLFGKKENLVWHLGDVWIVLCRGPDFSINIHDSIDLYQF